MLQSLLSAARKANLTDSSWKDHFQRNCDRIPRTTGQQEDPEESTTCYQLTVNNIEAVHRPVVSSSAKIEVDLTSSYENIVVYILGINQSWDQTSDRPTSTTIGVKSLDR